MKTDNGIEIIQDFIGAGRANRPGWANPGMYITIHETGNTAAGSGAKNHAAYLKSDAATKPKVSWHYTVDDRQIYQHLPDHESAYHAGDGRDGPGNRKSIGIEICVNSDGDFEQAKENAASLVRLLMKNHRIGLDRVVQHNHWSGKNCPQTIRETGKWGDFLAMVQTDAPRPSTWAKDAWEKAVSKGVFDGTDPQGAMTREMMSVVLDRLGLLGKE